MNENWQVGALAEETTEAKREAAIHGLSEYIQLGDQLRSLGAQIEELTKQKATVLELYKAKLTDLMKNKLVQPNKVYLIDGKAVVVTPKRTEGTGANKKPVEFDFRVLEIG